MGDIPLDFDTLQPHGCFIGSAAVIILSQHDRARDAALNLMRSSPTNPAASARRAASAPRRRSR